MTQFDPSTTPDQRSWRMPALIAGVVLVAVIAGLLFAFVLNRDPDAAAGDPSPTASPSVPATPSADPSPSEEPAPTETPPVAAPDEWTLVHSFGDESTRWTGGEIAWGDAGFLAIGRRYEGGEGGPRIAEYAMWRSADGREWTQVAYPSPDGGGTYDPAALSGAADGSYVLHAMQVNPEATETALVSLRSTDGETWEPLETGLRPDMFVESIEEGPSGYLLVGGQGGQTNPTLWLSSDALTWELVHEFSQDEENVQLYGADGGAEGYVVIGRRIAVRSSSYERFAFASADGREWVESPAPFGPDDQEYVWDVAVTSHGDNWLATLGDPEPHDHAVVVGRRSRVVGSGHPPGARAQPGRRGPVRGDR